MDVKNIRELGDAIIVAVAGIRQKQKWPWFIAHWKTFLDGIKGDNLIPAEFFDLSDDEGKELAAHWRQTMANHGIPVKYFEPLTAKILDILHDGYEIWQIVHDVNPDA